MKMKWKCTGPKYMAKDLGRWSKRYMGGLDMVRGTGLWNIAVGRQKSLTQSGRKSVMRI